MLRNAAKKDHRKDYLPEVPVFSKKPFTFSQNPCVFFSELPPAPMRPCVRVRQFPRVRVSGGSPAGFIPGASSGA